MGTSGTSTRKKRALFIAYHFPPLQGSTGTSRTLAFAKYLRDWNWEVTVLTVKPNLYPQIREENYADIPDFVNVVRASALDTQRHLSIFGRYPLVLATPDRWQSWIISGLFSALKTVRKWKPDVIVSTYPIASAHCIGYLINKLTNIPWVADFRDPMAQDGYPPERLVHWSYTQIEKLVFNRAARIVVTAPGTADIYRQRFPEYPADHIVTIPNGFDPEMFADAPSRADTPKNSDEPQPFCLLHSGLLYPEERNPKDLFAALSELKTEGKISSNNLKVVFRAPGNEENYRKDLARLAIQDIVALLPPIPYQEALTEMHNADGLLLMQATNCNQQIPAKLYEYLYCGKAILGLTDPEGDTGKLLRQLGVSPITKLDAKDEIKTSIMSFVELVRNGRAYTVPKSEVLKFSRRERTAELAHLLDGLISANPVLAAET